MQEFPHRYNVRAVTNAEDTTTIESANLPSLTAAPPAEFGGPGDCWSPETLLVAAVADCFILTFKAIARASKLDWLSLSCQVEGVLDRLDRVTSFTDFNVEAHLVIPEGGNQDQAQRILEKAELNCLVTNSLKADAHLAAEVSFG
jgi:organic hydroperoxide reductase OsmC/OhrA